MKLQRQNNRLM